MWRLCKLFSSIQCCHICIISWRNTVKIKASLVRMAVSNAIKIIHCAILFGLLHRMRNSINSLGNLQQIISVSDYIFRVNAQLQAYLYWLGYNHHFKINHKLYYVKNLQYPSA